MKNATYKDGILTAKGKRYRVIDRINNNNGHCLMILQEEEDIFMEKKHKTAEWAFPERLENIDDYDWENTSFLKRIW